MLQGKGWKYFLLEEGDMIQEGDEYYNPQLDQWLPVSDGEPEIDEPSGEIIGYPEAIIGYGWDAYEYKPIRRKNN